jgi:hypothetical protein
VFDWLMSIFDHARGLDQTAPPMWQSRGSRMRKSRTPFSSSRKRGPGELRMQVEAFRDKEARLERFRELRAKDTPDVCKWSGGDGKGAIWYVAHN